MAMVDNFWPAPSQFRQHNIWADLGSDEASDVGDAVEAKPGAVDDTPMAPLEPQEVGMTVGYKQLYSGKEDRRGRFQWQTEVPKDVGKPAEDSESERWALIVRRTRVFNDPKKVLAIHSIVVQSPLIKDILEDILKGYPGITVTLKRLEFSGRYVFNFLSLSFSLFSSATK